VARQQLALDCSSQVHSVKSAARIAWEGENEGFPSHCVLLLNRAGDRSFLPLLCCDLKPMQTGQNYGEKANFMVLSKKVFKFILTPLVITNYSDKQKNGICWGAIPSTGFFQIRALVKSTEIFISKIWKVHKELYCQLSICINIGREIVKRRLNSKKFLHSECSL